MAQFSFHGLDDLILDMEAAANIPDEVQDEMLTAQAEVVIKAQREEAKKLGMYEGYSSAAGNVRMPTRGDNILWGQEKSYSTGQLARSLRISKPYVRKDVRHVKIYFSGYRKRGNTRTSNAEIAFLNEFGTRNINARHFIWVANEKCAEDTTKAAAEVYDRFLKSKNL